LLRKSSFLWQAQKRAEHFVIIVLALKTNQWQKVTADYTRVS